ncbi:carbohydrate ABC transporter permease, partial [Bifidobacterium longum]
CAVFAVYCLFPFVYLLINATKTQADFTSTFGLGFGKTFALFDNIATVFSYQDGIFARWLFNTILYVVVGAGGATLLAIMGGYALAKFRFPGRNAVFVVIIGAISVPGIALAVPQFLLFAKLGLTNTPWAMIIPSLISPFGLYLMWIFSEQAVPQELLEAARVDGASEFRTFWQISLPLLAPGIVTTALFTIVATWNNYFLPLIMLKDADWYPLTIGLNQWKDQASTAGGQAIQNLVITGSLITIIPLVIAFLCLQKYWQSGLAAGAVKE